MANDEIIARAARKALAAVEDAFLNQPAEEDEDNKDFLASDWVKTDEGKKAWKSFRKAALESDELDEEDDIEEDEDEPKAKKARKASSDSDVDEDDLEEDDLGDLKKARARKAAKPDVDAIEEDEDPDEDEDEPKAKKARKASSDSDVDEDDIEVEDDEPKVKKARRARKASSELDEEFSDAEMQAAFLDMIDAFVDKLRGVKGVVDEDDDIRETCDGILDKFVTSRKCKSCIKRVRKCLDDLKTEDEDEIDESDDDKTDEDTPPYVYNDDDDIGVNREEFDSIIDFVRNNPDLVNEETCPICGLDPCTCDIEEDDAPLNLDPDKTGKKSKKAKKASGEDDPDEDEDPTEDEDESKAKKARKASSDDIEEDDDPEEDEDKLDEDDEDPDKEAKRAARNARRRARRAVERAYANWKNAYKASKAEKDPDEDELEPIAKKVKRAAKARAQAVKEAFQQTIGMTGRFGTLSESESKAVSETAAKTVNKFLNEAVTRISEDTIKAADRYIAKVVVPHVQHQFNEYVDAEMKPELYEQFESYMDYAVQHIWRKLEKNGLAVRSRDSQQLTEFREDLLDLIKEKLKIIPRRENAITVLENQVSSVATMLEDEKIKKIRIQRKLDETRKENWILKNLPDEISESRRESLKDKLSDISEDMPYDEFVVKASKTLDVFMESIHAGSANTAQIKTKTDDRIKSMRESVDPFEKASSLF